MLKKRIYTYPQASACISESGIRVTPRTVRNWAKLHPAIRGWIGGRPGIHEAAVEMIAAGTPLITVAERMRALSEAPPDRDGGESAARWTGEKTA
jgi:hypothetical protein